MNLLGTFSWKHQTFLVLIWVLAGVSLGSSNQQGRRELINICFNNYKVENGGVFVVTLDITLIMYPLLTIAGSLHWFLEYQKF